MFCMYSMYCTAQDLPESLSKLKKLQRLDLGDNEIDFLPPHIGDLESLEGLFTPQFAHFCGGLQSERVSFFVDLLVIGVKSVRLFELKLI